MSEAKIGNVRAVRRALLAWHAGNALQAPWRESGDPYEALVAAVMAQQTQMSRVMPSYERFVAAFPTLDALAAASLGDVIRVWAGMGYNQRAVRLHRAARTIAAGGWPRDAAALARIDGIGPFTAAIIASFAFGEPAACVDTNVRRVLGRLSGDQRIVGKSLQLLADAFIDRREPARWNQALMDYGARVCLPRPRCGECVVRRWCAFMTPATDAVERGSDRARPALVADERASYAPMATARKKPQQPFEESDRYYRGRIIDVLRGLAPGDSIDLHQLARRIANGRGTPSAAATAQLVSALERHGLLVTRRAAISLPD